MKKVKRWLRVVFNYIWYVCHYRSQKKTYKVELDTQWEELCEYISQNENVQYNNVKKITRFQSAFKWVGGVLFGDKVIGIANGAEACLLLDTMDLNIQQVGKLSQGEFKWTGGCLWDGIVYGFPRSSNDLLLYDVGAGKEPEQVSLGLNYKGEHHYGGVCTKEGVVYQPPRNSNSILKIDLKNKETEEIFVSKSKIKFRYCGSILHPNGLIYMFPETMGRVLVLNPKTDEVSFIGKILSTMVFDAAIGMDGCIYGFSAYRNGLLKINPVNHKTEMICTEEFYGCYGSVLGLNGNIVGIPGEGGAIYEFNVSEQKVYKKYELLETGHAKCAGSAIGKDGKIYCIPAYGQSIYIIEPSGSVNIPDKFLTLCYLNGNY